MTRIRKCEVPDSWTIEKGHYILGNKYSPVAVPHVYNTDGTKRGLCERLLKVPVDASAAIAGYYQTANIGIEKVIMNVIANPNIRYLIVAGHENQHFTGKALLSVIKHGVDSATHRIPGRPEAKTGYLPNLPIEAINRFRSQVTIIDLLLPDKEPEIDKLELRPVTIGTKTFLVPTEIYDGDGTKVIKITRLSIYVIDEILRLVVHACLQEPEKQGHC